MIKDLDLQHISIANLTVGQTPQTELIQAAAEAGFGAVGLLIMTATSQALQHELIGEPAIIRETKAALKDTGVRVFDIEAFVLSPDTDLERFKPALELGAELGATHISSIGTELSPHAQLLSDEQRVDLFGRLCDAASEFGLTVGVEFMLYRDIRTWQDGLRMIEGAGRKNAGLIMDTLHYFRAGSKPSDILHIPPNRIAYAQLCDCMAASPRLEDLPAEARTSRLHLGDGAIPLREMIERLPADLQLVIETPVKADSALSTRERARSAAERSSQFFRTLM